MNVKQRILAIIAREPNIESAVIAARLGCRIPYVSQVRGGHTSSKYNSAEYKQAKANRNAQENEPR